MRWIKVIVSSLICMLVAACSTVPITGRQQLSLIPDASLISMSFQQYGQFMEKNSLSKDQEKANMVREVGVRIQHAVEAYLNQNNMKGDLANYKWEFSLVESKEINAWCMPGGKVVVYTGILPYTRDKAGLAVVMGHEIAHAIAKHGNERMSQGLITQLGGQALAEAMKTKPGATQQLWMSVYGLGAQYGVLMPYSRLHEKEADHLGLIFMAMAGYDPNVAVDFWQRMAAKEGKKSTPEFLSTHPSDRSRIASIQSLIPKVMPYYRP